MSLLSARDLTVTYQTQGGPVPAVRGVDLEIDRGRGSGLAGESGCGKSSIAGAILRLHPKAPRIAGDDPARGEGRPRAAPRQAARAPLDRRLHRVPGRDARDEPGAAHRRPDRRGDHDPPAGRRTGSDGPGRRPARAGGSPGPADRDYPHELSGGQKQRVMIAMALACSPSLVIADEPTTALDVMVQAQVLKLLKRLQRELGLAMLFITHDLSVLVEVSDRLAIMYAGKIVEEGPRERRLPRPEHPYTRRWPAPSRQIGDQRFRRAPAGLGGDPPDPQPTSRPGARSTPGARRSSTRARTPSRAVPGGRGPPGRLPAAHGAVAARRGERVSADGRRARTGSMTGADRSSRSATSHVKLRRTGRAGRGPRREARPPTPAPSTASTSRSAGRGARAGGRVGLRQDHARARDHGPGQAGAGRDPVRGRVRSARTCARTGAGCRWSSRTRRRAEPAADDLRVGRGGPAHPQVTADGGERGGLVARALCRARACVRRNGSSSCTRTSCRAASASAW